MKCPKCGGDIFLVTASVVVDVRPGDEGEVVTQVGPIEVCTDDEATCQACGYNDYVKVFD